MATEATGEPPTVVDRVLCYIDKGRLKRGRSPGGKLNTIEEFPPLPKTTVTDAQVGDNHISYKMKLLNDDHETSEESEEEGEIHDDKYESDDDVFVAKIDGPSILLTKEDKRRIRKPWRKTLIIKLLGRSISYTYLCNRLKQLWSLVGAIQVIDLDHGFYCVKFRNSADYEYVFNGGPWIIADHYLTVRRWTPYFRSDEATIDSVAAWIRFPLMPMEFYDDWILKKMVEPIGKFIRIDKTTSSAFRGRFARLCAKVNLTKPLTPKIFIGGRWQKIEYEGL